MWDSQESDPKLVIRKRGALLLGWIILVAALVIISVSVFKLAFGEKEIGAAVLIPFVSSFALMGIWLAGLTTTVTFDRYAESMTVTRGYVPIYIWWQRTKSISRDTARTVHVTTREYAESTEYRVEVDTESGKTLMLFRDARPDDANDLVARIRRWSGVEC